MTRQTFPMLSKISETNETVASAEEDVRGRKVTSASGDDLGKVDDLLIDDEEHKVRFLLMEHGGFLGIGEKESLIPVDAITRITEDRVYIDRSREQVAEAPAYDPQVVQEPEYYDGLYAHYGYAPFWGAGYRYPGYPFYA